MAKIKVEGVYYEDEENEDSYGLDESAYLEQDDSNMEGEESFGDGQQFAAFEVEILMPGADTYRTGSGGHFVRYSLITLF